MKRSEKYYKYVLLDKIITQNNYSASSQENSDHSKIQNCRIISQGFHCEQISGQKQNKSDGTTTAYSRLTRSTFFSFPNSTDHFEATIKVNLLSTEVQS